MEETTKSLNLTSSFTADFFIIAGLLVFSPLLKNQMITGPLVNFLLFISAVFWAGALL